jgi:hypothetical protein
MANLQCFQLAPNISDNSSTETPNWVQKLSKQFSMSRNTIESSDKEVSAGYDLTRGFVNGQLLCPIPNCFAKTQEFGTRPGIFVGIAMVLENISSNVGKRDFAFATSWAFNPRRLSWRRQVLAGGIDALHAVVDIYLVETNIISQC